MSIPVNGESLCIEVMIIFNIKLDFFSVLKSTLLTVIR